MKLFGSEPTLIIAVVTSAIVLLGTVGFGFLTGEQAGLLVAAINAVALAVNAYTVRPISPAAFTYAVGAIVALVTSYGLEFTDAQVGAINALVISILALLTRGQVSPAPENPLVKPTGNIAQVT